MRICVVRHSFHEKTRSSDFMLDLLGEIGSTTTICFDPDAGPDHLDDVVRTLAGQDHDVYVFFQTEPVAERVLQFLRGRIVIVPMYDGAWQRPVLFWQQFVEATFISFCRDHHEFLEANSLRSRYFQYFPPVPPRSSRTLDERAAFYWERRPEQRLNINVVVELCRRLQVQRLHVHGAPDFSAHDNRRYQALAALHAPALAITHSAWFENKDAYEAVASVPLFFFAPRETEGIGLASLEAMARGQIVVAPDRPVLNEYVAHMTTGLLFDLGAPASLAIPSARQLDAMRLAAATKAADGRADWLEDVDRLKSIVADDGRRWSVGDRSSHFRNALTAAAARRAFDRVGLASGPALATSDAP